jgi:hypothetical protein
LVFSNLERRVEMNPQEETIEHVRGGDNVISGMVLYVLEGLAILLLILSMIFLLLKKYPTITITILGANIFGWMFLYLDTQRRPGRYRMMVWTLIPAAVVVTSSIWLGMGILWGTVLLVLITIEIIKRVG